VNVSQASVRVRELESALVAGAGSALGLVVDVTSSSARNPVHRAFSALRAIGVQIAHARIRLEPGTTVQVLELREADDRILAAHRVPQVVAALRDAFGLPSRESAALATPTG